MALQRALLSSRLSSSVFSSSFSPSLPSPLSSSSSLSPSLSPLLSSFSTSPPQAARGEKKKKREEGEGGSGKGYRKLFYILPAFSFSLGVWQVKRYKWKKGILEERERKSTEGEEISLPPLSSLSLEQIEEYNFKRVRLTGKYLNDQEILVYGRTYKSRPGYHVVQPFLQSGDNSVVLINRGWVPMDMKNFSARPNDFFLEGEVELHGIFRKEEKIKESSLAPKSNPDKKEWLNIDIGGFCTQFQPGVEKFGKMFPKAIIDSHEVKMLEENQENNAKYPIGAQTVLSTTQITPFTHLTYATTWFSLAAVITYLIRKWK